MGQPDADLQDFYADPWVYDVLHASGTASEVRGLEAIEARFSRARGERDWLEPACGSGRYLAAAAGRGTRVVGFDLSPAMVEYARRRLARFGARARVVVASMADFGTALARSGLSRRRFSLAFNPVNTIRHLECDADAIAHLEETRGALRRGGVYVVGISLSVYGGEGPSEDVWVGRRAGATVTQAVQYLPPSGRGRGERVISHMTVTARGVERHIDSRYVLRRYDLGQWTRLVDRAGMRILGVVDERGRDSEVDGAGYWLFVLSARAGRRG